MSNFNDLKPGDKVGTEFHEYGPTRYGIVTVHRRTPKRVFVFYGNSGSGYEKMFNAETGREIGEDRNAFSSLVPLDIAREKVAKQTIESRRLFRAKVRHLFPPGCDFAKELRAMADEVEGEVK